MKQLEFDFDEIDDEGIAIAAAEERAEEEAIETSIAAEEESAIEAQIEDEMIDAAIAAEEGDHDE